MGVSEWERKALVGYWLGRNSAEEMIGTVVEEDALHPNKGETRRKRLPGDSVEVGWPMISGPGTASERIEARR
jgi:hypothetical protein